MSYFICTVARFKKQALAGLEKENERLESYRDVTRHIDASRTKFNYHLVHPHGEYTDFVEDRIRLLDLKRSIRRNAVYLCSLVISASSYFFNTMSSYEERDFFESCSDALCDRFGRENVVSAVVHKDETRPHMHFNFVPVKDGTLSATKVIAGDLYADFLTQIYDVAGRPWGLEKGDLSSGRRKMPMQQYKHKMAVERAAELEDKIVEESKRKKEDFFETDERVSELKSEESRLKLSVDALSNEKKNLEKDIEALGAEKGAHTMVESARIPIFKKKNTIEALLRENAALRLSNEDLKRMRGDDLDEAKRLKEENEAISTKLESRDRLASMAETAIKTDPEKFRAILKEANAPEKDMKKGPEK